MASTVPAPGFALTVAALGLSLSLAWLAYNLGSPLRLSRAVRLPW